MGHRDLITNYLGAHWKLDLWPNFANLAAKLVCLSIVVAYGSSKCPFTNFSKLGQCDLIVIWIWFLFAGELWVVSIIYLITLDLCWPCSVSRSFINIWHIRCTPVTWQKTAERYSPSSVIAGAGVDIVFALCPKNQHRSSLFCDVYYIIKVSPKQQ